MRVMVPGAVRPDITKSIDCRLVGRQFIPQDHWAFAPRVPPSALGIRAPSPRTTTIFYFQKNSIAANAPANIIAPRLLIAPESEANLENQRILLSRAELGRPRPNIGD